MVDANGLEPLTHCTPSRRPLARMAPCCFMQWRKQGWRAGLAMTRASPKRRPFLVPPMVKASQRAA